MNKELVFNQDICLRAKDYHKGRGHSLSNVVFLFRGFCYFIGFDNIVFPSLILSREIQTVCEQQSNLLSASAGNDLRMSTMRPNPYLSAEVKMRKSKFRGFFQLFSRPI